MNQKIPKSEWQKKSRRSFLIAGGSFLLGGLGLWLAENMKYQEGVPWPFRKVLAVNESIWRQLFSKKATAESPPAPAPGTPARINSDIGMEEDLDLKDWRLAFSPNEDIDDAKDSRNLYFTMKQLSALPQIEHTEVFKCVEGWSQVISYKGICFKDFLTELKINPKDFSYVGLQTPDAAYYVSIDMDSMLHEKTLLALEMNGIPLTVEHGAPLRLIIPVKYGIKNLKRIGRIFLANERPSDYWTEQGYDWYAGL